MSVISVPGMLRQEGNEVEANLGYISKHKASLGYLVKIANKVIYYK